jgi:glycosyltransferase involved in cell wall biosynthesis
LRILQVCKKFPYPLNDGERIAIYQLTKGLTEAGAEVQIAALNTQKHYTDVTSIPVHFHSKHHIQSVDIDTTPKFGGFISSFFRGTAYNIDRFYSKIFEHLLIQLLKENAFDLVQLEGTYLSPYVQAIRKNTNAKIVLRSHNIEHIIWQRNAHQANSVLRKQLYSFMAQRMEKAETRLLDIVDAIVPISPVDAEWFRERGFRKPLHTSFTGFDEPTYQTNLFNEQLKLYYLGSMDWLPNAQGVKWFIQNVWLNIIEKQLPLTLHLPAHPEQHLFEQVNGIVWYQQVDDVQQFIADKDLLIVPLFSGSGIRIKIPEALNQGRVVVSTSIGAEGLGLTHNKEIIIADDAKSFLDEIISLHQNRSRFNTIAHNGYLACRSRFDNRVITRELLQFYHTL